MSREKQAAYWTGKHYQSDSGCNRKPFVLLWTLVASLTLAACSGSDTPVQSNGGQQPEQQSPNFLLIVADDLGYSDIGAFGGEIDTPNLDQIAKTGVRLTDFYVSPTCSPTRAMLLTGNDSHVAGLGSMAEALRPEQRGKPGYEGHLNQSVATIAERLRNNGYFTAMTGKWHLGFAPQQIPAARGFDRSFTLLNGSGNYYGLDQGDWWKGTLFQARYFEDNQPGSLPEGAYTTDYFATRLIEFLTENHADSGKPFFAYLAFNAPHTPLQAPMELVKKYNGVYDDGPEALRKQRLERLKSLALIPDDAAFPPMIDTPEWSGLSEAQKIASSRRMQIYAAAVDRLDHNIGRVIAALEASGELDNTIIIFLSDNGAEGTDENYWLGFQQFLGLPENISQLYRTGNSNPAQTGTATSYPAYGPGWAQAGMAAFRLTKGFTTDGGIRAPLLVSGPGIIRGQISHAITHVTDIVPTILDMAGITPADTVNGKRVQQPQGVSFKSLLLDQYPDHAAEQSRRLGWELFGRRAIRSGSWKAVYMNEPSIERGSGAGEPYWSLFNIEQDPGETTNLAAQYPELLSELIASWQDYAETNGVIAVPPLGERGPPRHTKATPVTSSGN